MTRSRGSTSEAELSFLRQLRLARIAPQELKKLIEAGESPVVLDVRTASSRKRDTRRIPTAIVANTDDLEGQLGSLSPDTEIVLYCT